MSSLLDQAFEELSEVRAAIRELQLRKDILETFVKAYSEVSSCGSYTTKSAAPPCAPVISMSSEVRDTFSAAGSTLFATAKEAIAETCYRLLADGAALHTRELLKELEVEGVSVGGKDQVTTVSAILSKDGRFKADRKHGWSLKTAEELSQPSTGEPEFDGMTI